MARTKQTMRLKPVAKQLFPKSPETSLDVLTQFTPPSSPIVDTPPRTPEPYLKRPREASPFEALKLRQAMIGKSRRVDPQEWLDAQSPICLNEPCCTHGSCSQCSPESPTEIMDTPVSTSGSELSFDYDLNSEEEELLEQICLCIPTRMCTFCRMRGVIDLTNDE